MRAPLETPALIYDEGRLRRHLGLLSTVRQTGGVRALYSIKAMPLVALLERIAPAVDGFSVSSLFEAQLAQGVLQKQGTVARSQLHITTPGLKPEDIEAIAECCDAISFNSLEQFQRLYPVLQDRAVAGLRVNPGCSFVTDDRYNPCRSGSKLGIPLSELQSHTRSLTGLVKGLHFHTLFGSTTREPLRITLQMLESALGDWLDTLEWVNCGGGYLIEDVACAEELAEILGTFSQRHGVEVYIEPGNALVGMAGTLVVRVLDVFQRDGETIVVVDSGVHHLPEVFEYQRAPRLMNHMPDGPCQCQLVGSSCLAGDIFGRYRLAEPLKPGDLVTFEQVGAYSMVKASRFNGHDLPVIYLREIDGSLKLLKRFGYESFRGQWDTLDTGAHLTVSG